METQFIEFTAKVGSWEPGHIESFPRSVAEGYIAAGQATASDAVQHMRTSLQADADKRFAAFEERLLGVLKPQPTNTERKGPPTGGGGVNFDRIDGGDPLDPAKLKQHERWYHAGQMVRALLSAQATDAEPQDREWGTNILRKLYCTSRVDYKVEGGDDQKNVARFNDNIGVTRTGTESISGGPSYGFLVKPEWSEQLFRIPIEESVVEPGAFQVPVGQALEFKMPALDQYNAPASGQSAAYAGFSLGRKGEITKRTYSDGKTNEIDFKITDLTAFTTYSRDLDADAFIRIGAMIQQVLGQAFQWKKDFEFIMGNGVGGPLGILNGGAPAANLPPSVLNVDRATASKIFYEDIVAMMKQIHPSLWRGMYWITNQAQTLDQLVAIRTSASGNAFVFLPSAMVGQWEAPRLMGEGNPYNNLTWRAQGLLMGKPVFFSEKLPQLGSTGDLILLNPIMYGVATRAGLEMGMSEHFLFDTDTIAVRWKLRNDAKPMMRGPYIQNDANAATGSKVSWCSVLAVHS